MPPFGPAGHFLRSLEQSLAHEYGSVYLPGLLLRAVAPDDRAFHHLSSPPLVSCRGNVPLRRIQRVAARCEAELGGFLQQPRAARFADTVRDIPVVWMSRLSDAESTPGAAPLHITLL